MLFFYQTFFKDEHFRLFTSCLTFMVNWRNIKKAAKYFELCSRESHQTQKLSCQFCKFSCFTQKHTKLPPWQCYITIKGAYAEGEEKAFFELALTWQTGLHNQAHVFHLHAYLLIVHRYMMCSKLFCTRIFSHPQRFQKTFPQIEFQDQLITSSFPSSLASNKQLFCYFLFSEHKKKQSQSTWKEGSNFEHFFI